MPQKPMDHLALTDACGVEADEKGKRGAIQANGKPGRQGEPQAVHRIGAPKGSSSGAMVGANRWKCEWKVQEAALQQ